MNKFHENLTFWHYETFLGELICSVIDYNNPYYVFQPNSEFINNYCKYYTTIKTLLFTNNPIPHLQRNHFNRGFQILQEGNKRAMEISLPILHEENIYKFRVNRNFTTYQGGKLTEEFEFFFEKENALSPWYSCNFENEGNQFSTSIQFLLYKKALLFNDHDSKNLILETTNSEDLKEIGRSISGFNESIWKNNVIEIAYEANKHKFVQNPKLLIQLLETSGKTLVEASSSDLIWGIGHSKDSREKENRASWKGDNLLGIILTELREELRGANSYGEYGLGYFTGKEFKEKFDFYTY